MKNFILNVTYIVFILIPSAINAEEVFKVGMILSMTGSWSEFGEAQKQAVELAKKDRPDLFKHIEFIYEDCGYASKNAVTAFNKLKDSDKIDAIFVWGVEPSLAVAPLAETYKIPLFVSALDPRAAQGREYVVRTINYALQHSKKMSDYLRSKSYKKIGIVQAELSFFNVLINGLKANLEQGESIELVDSMLPNQVDFRSVIYTSQLNLPEANEIRGVLEPQLAKPA
ncbi:MAG: ABC transporter substrate-binding protein [Bdellovibrionota bacterium]